MRRLLLAALLLLAACGQTTNPIAPGETHYELSWVSLTGVGWIAPVADLEWIDSSGVECTETLSLAEPGVYCGMDVHCAAYRTEFVIYTRDRGRILGSGQVAWQWQSRGGYYSAVLIIS